MRESGEAFVRSLGITEGLKVLDLGCGDGTTALPAARLGADVLGVDIASNLVEAGNQRAGDAGLTNCRFQEGDASNLYELRDHRFDLVVSILARCLRRSRSMSPAKWCAALVREDEL
jgi:ubiquinone/menaquinone biosynthesis C-methylase UbiE